MKQETLRKLQLTEFGILKDFAKLADQNNLEYFLIGGTLLGAVRHKGFIPWDDDVDIGMPRKDYEKFIKICKTQLDSKYFLHCHKTDSKYWLPFAKIRLNNTLFNEPAVSKLKAHKGIYIDIFPLDNAKRQTSKMQRLQAYICKNLSVIILWRRGVDKKMDERRIIRLAFHISKIFSIKMLNRMMHFVMSWNKNIQSDYFVGLASNYNYIEQTIPKSKYFSAKEIKFEGGKFHAPNDYDYVLRRIYKDYMKIPSPEKQITHAPVALDFGKGPVNF